MHFNVTVNMTGVMPDTVYLVKIVACTPGGCTESDDGKEVTTYIEGDLVNFFFFNLDDFNF